ncbi:hypothetical protein SIL73_14875 [Acidithiobacillus thiooxidans]|nr:hypothetical protein [Acidithiobacillus thiooxidans]MDX5935949.1 hypothetical protein [Acidithiobacillus thiooxidans]
MAFGCKLSLMMVVMIIPPQTIIMLNKLRMKALLKEGPLLKDLLDAASSQHHHQPMRLHPNRKLNMYNLYLFLFFAILYHSDGKK